MRRENIFKRNEYEEALNEAKYGWCDECEDGFEYDVNSENYKTEEEYIEAIKSEEKTRFVIKKYEE